MSCKQHSFIQHLEQYFSENRLTGVSTPKKWTPSTRLPPFLLRSRMVGSKPSFIAQKNGWERDHNPLSIRKLKKRQGSTGWKYRRNRNLHGDPWGAMSHTSLRPMEGIPLHTQICPFYYDQTWDHGSPIGGFMNDGWGVAP